MYVSQPEAAEQLNWKNMVRPFQTSDTKRSLWQVVNTFVPFIILWIVMYLSLQVGYWLTLLLALPTAGMLVRIFIIQHDCGHGSFFKSRQANDRLGVVCGMLTLTPYYQWRKSHAVHHATAGNLARRDVHDVYTMTVREYNEAPLATRVRYRLYRNPITLFLILPLALFLVLYRFPGPLSRRKERLNVLWNDLALVIIVALVSLVIGFRPFLLVHLPVVIIASMVGTWLFFVQHQFEDTYWADGEEWDYATAALQGSSFYRLPKVLQWFTGNIGFHHIHHLSPRIPNYRLEECHQQNPELQNVSTLTLGSSLRTTFLSLWDEEAKKLVSFRTARRSARLTRVNAVG
ncbi:MAG: fatty acid desaturase [Ardenticatenaceae bacterium]|nr:fatty acid desaturase [Ardenticatenaceae bacterium]